MLPGISRVETNGEPNQTHRLQYLSLAKCIRFSSLRRTRKKITFLLHQILQYHLDSESEERFSLVITNESPDNPKNGNYKKLGKLSRALSFEPGTDFLLPPLYIENFAGTPTDSGHHP